MTTSENREALRAFVREHITSNTGGVVTLHLVALLQRQEEQLKRGFKVDADPTFDALVKSISNGFVHEPDQAAIVTAATAWLSSQGIAKGSTTSELLAAVAGWLDRNAKP
jgi:hypothetical protein